MTICHKALALSLAIVAVPAGALAQTQFVRYAPVSPRWFPTLYVKTGASVDISLEDGDTLNSEAIVADPRWKMTSVTSGSAVHIILKPSESLEDVQLLTVPGARHTYHVLLRSGKDESTTYTLAFFEPPVKRPAAMAKAVPPPSPPRVVTVTSCAPPLDAAYRVSGDARIPVAAACDDGVRTFIIMRSQRGSVAAVPYRVDAGGRQDQITNASYSALNDSHGQAVGVWTIDGVFSTLALVADSSRGQIRTEITHNRIASGP